MHLPVWVVNTPAKVMASNGLVISLGIFDNKITPGEVKFTFCWPYSCPAEQGDGDKQTHRNITYIDAYAHPPVKGVESV